MLTNYVCIKVYICMYTEAVMQWYDDRHCRDKLFKTDFNECILFIKIIWLEIYLTYQDKHSTDNKSAWV